LMGEVVTISDMSLPRRAWFRVKSLLARRF
jgi:hypothetical protein